MLFVFLNWIVILITTFSLGFGILQGIEKVFHYQVKRLDMIILAGLILATTYAQYFSIVYRVNWEAMLVWSAISLLSILIWHKKMLRLLQDIWQIMGKTQKIVIFFLVVLIIYFTSRGYFISDTNLYHAQCIRWIEEYGVVKGLGNLQSRASYNSSFFCLTALYSMKYLFGQSMHAVQGFMALLLAVECTRLGKMKQRKRPVLSDFARVAAVYYLTLLHKEILSPSSDYAVMIVLFFIIIRWLELLEEKENALVPYALLCVVGAYTVTLKLTAGLILVLLAKPLYELIRRKKWRDMFLYFMMGVVTVMPFLIRNVLISGWLIYPFTALDLFSVDWKVPKVIASADAYQIKSWGKGIHEYGILENDPTSWIPNWFSTMLTTTEKVLIILDVVAILFFLIHVIYTLIHLYLIHRKASSIKESSLQWNTSLVMLTLTVSFLFWLFSAPLTRYGYAYILLLPVVILGNYSLHFIYSKKTIFCKIIRKVFLVLLLLLLCWKGIVLAKDAYSESILGYYIHQTDYENNEGDSYVKEFEINGITFYYGVSGYHKLPGGGITFTMRGDSIKDGFRYQDKSEESVFGEKVR